MDGCLFPGASKRAPPDVFSHALAYVAHDMKVHEIMTGNPRSIAPGNTLVEAAGLMRELDVGALPVLDDNRLAGIVTDRDLVVRGIADGRDPSSATVSDVMSGGTERVFADQEVEEAVQLMEKRQIRRLPVLDREERLVGMVSLGDIATSSNPAFSGMALRDVSESNQPSARRRRLAQESEPARMPEGTGQRRGPSGVRRGSGASTRIKTARASTAGRSEPRRKANAKARGAAAKSTSSRSRRAKSKKSPSRSRR